jgi:hypothetical protein
MTSKVSSEAKLYPIVEKWMKKHFQCFQTAKNTGLIHGRIDVVGVRDVGGILSGDIETISIEVKRGTEAFATASGQALGYKIYANRVYLADIRSDSFSHDEIKIASHLGIGLIQIKNRKCQEILSSPFYVPMISHNLSLLEKLALGKCQSCGSFFTTGNINKKYNKWENLSRVMETAYDNYKGFWWWHEESGKRKTKMGISNHQGDEYSDRRFMCPDCVYAFFKDNRE